MACKNRVFVSTRVEAAKLLPSSVAPATELLDSTTVSGLAVRRNVGLGSPTNSQPGRLRYVAQASGLRVLAASSLPVLVVPSKMRPAVVEAVNVTVARHQIVELGLEAVRFP